MDIPAFPQVDLLRKDLALAKARIEGLEQVGENGKVWSHDYNSMHCPEDVGCRMSTSECTTRIFDKSHVKL
jgi:hypothetical protein